MLMVSRKTLLARGPPPRSRYEQPDRRRGPVGRYDRRGDERPLEHLPNPSLNARTAVVSIPSANPADKGKRDDAVVNRRVDVLEDELWHNHISESAYQAGRVAQAVFERARGPGGSSNWQGGSRVDAYTSTELHIIHGLEDARKIHAYVVWMRGEIGKFDTALLVSVLRDRKTYAECAAMELELGERGISYIAKRFRRSLQSLADSRAAHGRSKA